MAKKKRTRYTLECKREALQLWEDSGKSAAVIEIELGLTAGILYQWKSALKKAAEAEVDGKPWSQIEKVVVVGTTPCLNRKRGPLPVQAGVFVLGWGRIILI